MRARNLSWSQAGKALKFKKLSDGHYAVDPTGETKLVTGEKGEMKGKIIIDGLDVGDYKLKETKAPDNFNLMQGEKDVTIEQNGEAQEKHLLANTNDKENSKSAYWYQTVVDKRISGLPATGGMGTTIFMVAGIAVMAWRGRRVDGRAQAPEAREADRSSTKRAARKRVSGGVRSKHEKSFTCAGGCADLCAGAGHHALSRRRQLSERAIADGCYRSI